MTKIMLIDATHPEETRVAVVDGRRLEEFDVEVASRHPLKGNIYLAKVTRVEPSLQAAFVEYGGNRHGFLAFSEIHPDYYRIPIADREALLAEEIEESASEERNVEEADAPNAGDSGQNEPGPTEEAATSVMALESRREELAGPPAPEAAEPRMPEAAEPREPETIEPADVAARPQAEPWAEDNGFTPSPWSSESQRSYDRPAFDQTNAPRESPAADERPTDEDPSGEDAFDKGLAEPREGGAELPSAPTGRIVEVSQPPEVIDTVGGEEPAPQEEAEDEEEASARRQRHKHLRRYKIQEVIKRRQILLVQVTKEERGNKGAALTTYMSLAGRYCVLMPNTDRGGGISRRITNANDRKRLKSIIDELDLPEGMAVIVRTAGFERSLPEIKRDFEYLLRLWDEIRETTLRSTAPALIYEEASLIKRSIRDLYTRDIGDIIVAGTEAYKAAKSFMRMLAPAQAKRVQLYRDPLMPLFQRHQIEAQVTAMHNPVVHLKSGGYIVINQTEALVAVDVNSGRATRERNIEETALKTNIEAAEEIARQLRLRDLAGLIVIDFIDMDENRNNATVERRLKDALRNDRARIQLGRISSFGLLEMSRQRLHPSLQEASTEICAHCHGNGRVRSVDSTALHVLRSVEEEIARNPSPGATIHVPGAVALYILNQKRHTLLQMENRRGVRIYVVADDELTPPDYRLERIRQLAPGEEVLPALPTVAETVPEEFEEEIEIEETEELAESAAGTEPAEAETSESVERGGKGRRRRRRRGRGDRFRADDFTEQAEGPTGEARQGGETRSGEGPSGAAPAPFGLADSAQEKTRPGEYAAASETEADEDSEFDSETTGPGGPGSGGEDQPRRRRRRGRRGGRRRARRHGEEFAGTERPAAEQSAVGEFTGNAPQDRPAGFDTPGFDVPGLGEQPNLPDNMGSGNVGSGDVGSGDVGALPPAWRATEAPSAPAPWQEAPAGAEISQPAAAVPDRREESPEPRQRRQRRPRKEKPDTTPEAPVSEISVSEISAGGPAEPAPAPEAPESTTAKSTTAEPAAAEPKQPKKRGWWRSLVE